MQDGGFGYGVFARRFDAAGSAVGAEFQVNSFTDDFQSKAAVASRADGDFVIAWNSGSQDGDYFGVFAQRFTPVEQPSTSMATAWWNRSPTASSSCGSRFSSAA